MPELPDSHFGCSPSLIDSNPRAVEWDPSITANFRLGNGLELLAGSILTGLATGLKGSRDKQQQRAILSNGWSP